MKVRSLQAQDIRYIIPRFEVLYLSESNQWLSKIKSIKDNLVVRNQSIEWIFRSKAIVKFDFSTLLLAVSILDRLILKGYDIMGGSLEFLSASLLFISTKFNEIVPLTLRRLNSLLKNDADHSVQEYLEKEKQILELLEYDLGMGETVYAQIAFLLGNTERHHMIALQRIVKKAILNPIQTFKFGADVLILAIGSMIKNTLNFREYEPRIILQANQIRKEMFKILNCPQPSYYSPRERHY